MTLQELYQEIGGDYNQVLRVLRMEKLVDKHIRKFPGSGAVESLLAAGDNMDPVRLFEAAHAVKGIAGNLGLTGLSEAGSRITEEFRPGNSRKMTDEEVRELLGEIGAMYRKTAAAISRYAEG